MDSIGKILKRMRILYGDSAKDFCIKIDISPSYLSEIENNKRQPSLKILENYSKVLGIKVSTILLIAESKNDLKNENKIKQILQPIMKRIIMKGF